MDEDEEGAYIFMLQKWTRYKVGWKFVTMNLA